MSSKSELPYKIVEVVAVKYLYNENYGDYRVCKCGHKYYRHFDTYENMENCGCKYCRCHQFEEQTNAGPPTTD